MIARAVATALKHVLSYSVEQQIIVAVAVLPLTGNDPVRERGSVPEKQRACLTDAYLTGSVAILTAFFKESILMAITRKEKMDPITNFGQIIDQYFARIVAVNLIIWGPIIIALSQVGLSIRELALNSRKEYNSDDSNYESLKWIASAFFYIGWLMLPLGIILLIKTFS